LFDNIKIYSRVKLLGERDPVARVQFCSWFC